MQTSSLTDKLASIPISVLLFSFYLNPVIAIGMVDLSLEIAFRQGIREAWLLLVAVLLFVAIFALTVRKLIDETQAVTGSRKPRPHFLSITLIAFYADVLLSSAIWDDLVFKHGIVAILLRM